MREGPVLDARTTRRIGTGAAVKSPIPAPVLAKGNLALHGSSGLPTPQTSIAPRDRSSQAEVPRKRMKKVVGHPRESKRRQGRRSSGMLKVAAR